MPEVLPPPPIADQPLSVVLVAVDSIIDLPTLVQHWSAHLTEGKREHEIILVMPPGQALQVEQPGVKIVVADQPGFGAALRVGFRQAQHPLLLYLPAQPEWQPNFFDAFLERIDKAHIVTGVRTGRKPPLPLHWLGFLYRGFVRVIFGIPLQPLPGWFGWRGYLFQRFIRWTFGIRLNDVNCPFRLLRREILKRMPIQSDGTFVHTELLAKANFLTRIVDEVPLPVPAHASPGSWFHDFRQVLDHPDFGTK